MNCLFCQQPTVLEYSSEHGPVEEAASIVSSHKCQPCDTNYFFTREKLISYCISYREYEAWFSMESNKFELRKLAAIEKGKDNSIIDWVYILTFNFLPTLTPQNIATRLPIFLTFL
jgi:hypothetical protein